MTRLPWFPFFHGDFLASTGGLRSDQRWAVINMMGTMWGEGGCSIPNDPEFIRIASQLPPKGYAKRILPVLALFVVEGDRLTHPGLRELHYKALARSAKMAAIGSLGGKARAATASRSKGRFLPPCSGNFSNKNNSANQPLYGENQNQIEKQKGDASPSPLDSEASASLRTSTPNKPNGSVLDEPHLLSEEERRKQADRVTGGKWRRA